MFRSAKALDRAKTHSSFRQAMRDYEKTAETWFTGSVDSVDRRLAHVDRLLHHVRATLARLNFADSVPQLRAAQSLSADRKHLAEFRRAMLNGAQDYTSATGCVGRTAAKTSSPVFPPSLPSADRRWVTLEAQRFVSANTDCLSDPEELATRARHHAALKTSMYAPRHSAMVTQAFIDAVVHLGRRSYRPPRVRQAAVQREDQVSPEAMFF